MPRLSHNATRWWFNTLPCIQHSVVLLFLVFLVNKKVNQIRNKEKAKVMWLNSQKINKNKSSVSEHQATKLS